MFFENKFVRGVGRRKEKETCLACGGGGVWGGWVVWRLGKGVCVLCVWREAEDTLTDLLIKNSRYLEAYYTVTFQPNRSAEEFDCW